MSTYTDVKAVMDKYGIPTWLWLPIAKTESGLNPLTTAANEKEVSKGVFQINVKAHPEYANVDLYNATTNAEIAAKSFILPAYEYAKTATSDQMGQALIVYSGLKNPYIGTVGGYIPGGAGIRPKWTDATQTRFIQNYKSSLAEITGTAIDTNVKSTVHADGTGSLAGGGGITFGGIHTNGTGTTLTGPWQNLTKFAIITGLVIMAAIALFGLFKDTAPVKVVTQAAKAAATGGASAILEGD